MSFFASRRLLRGRSPLSLALPRRGGGEKGSASSFSLHREGGDDSLARLRARDGERLRRYRELLDFYEGKHFARDRGRAKLVVNYARGVADKGVSYLFGRGVHFSVPAETETDERARDAERLLNRVAEESDLDLILLQAATNASVLGDAVLKLVWDPVIPLSPTLPRQGGGSSPAGALSPQEAGSRAAGAFSTQGERSLLGRSGVRPSPSPLAGEGWGEGARPIVPPTGRVRVVNVDPFQFFPTWASDDPSVLREVALAGQLSRQEAEERFGISGAQLTSGQSWLQTAGMLDTLECWTADRLWLEVGGQIVRDGPNPYGFIPFVHVANLQPPNSAWGVSDLTHLIPLNRELDERMSDQADMIRYHADPPVVFRGVEEHSDLPVGPGTVWDLPRDADVALLEWRGSTPAIQDHVERVLRAIYDVSETPRTSFGDSGRLLSGVALETELQPLVHRTLRKRVGWSAALRRCARMMLILTERFEPGRAPGVFAPYRSQVIWPQMLPRDDDADAQRNLSLVQGGLRSHRKAMEALGELEPEIELQRIRQERAYLDDTHVG